MAGEGHPNIKSPDLNTSGPSPCFGTDYKKRLMTMGTRRASNGTACRLVKGEWDLIEAWLRGRPNGDR